MRSIVYPGLLGFSGAACLPAAASLSRIEGNIVRPEEYRFLSALCWFSLGAGAVGAVWALVLRTSSVRKQMSTLVVSLCFAIVALSVWARVDLLPDHVGVPMSVPGANNRTATNPR